MFLRIPVPTHAQIGKKGKKKLVSIAVSPESDRQHKGSRNTITPPKTVTTDTVVTTSSEHNLSGPRINVQPTSHAEEHASFSAQEKRKKRKTKTKKQKLQPTVQPTYTSEASLSACPAEVLLSIIGFIRMAERRTSNRALSELRLVNRHFRYLLQPIIFGSVRMPPECGTDRALTKDIRKLLRLIEGNPSLAKDIKELSYYETGPGDMITNNYYLEELNDDCNIFLRYARELCQKSATFVFSVRPSDKHDISEQYNNMCAPLLLSRLTNLRKLSFYGHVGGGYALLLTPLAKEIWEQTPLKSVEVLCWEPQFIDYDYERTYWPTYDGYDYRRWLDPAKIPNNDWNVIAFLRFAPGLKQLDIHSDYFLDRATPHNPPLLQF
ncbi:hypothetical protein BZA77DRAFT_291864 [Pyronema omphalodes]|nr:hypothetical protein BZA77DRAFT_375425 [Pyronema omphalodes]KAI5817932.1 hypothetical protein BZA77DRAFT_291864 [Pyronema omphalodes]